MSNTDLLKKSESVSTHLRHRFLVLSSAVIGAMSASGIVCTAHLVRAQEENFPAQSSESSRQPDEETLEQPSQDAHTLDRQQFNELLRARKYDEISEKLDIAIAENPNSASLTSMEMNLAMRIKRHDSDQAKRRFTSILDRLMKRDAPSMAELSALSSVAYYLVNLHDQWSIQEKIDLCNSVIKRIQQTENSPIAYLRQVVLAKAAVLLDNGNTQQAKQELDAMLDKFRSEIIQNGRRPNNFIGFAIAYERALASEFPDDVRRVLDEAGNFALEELERADAKFGSFARLYSLKVSTISRLMYTEPERADEMLSELEDVFESFAGRLDESETGQLSSCARNLESLRSRVGPALARAKLIGAKAPEIDAEAFIGTEPVTMNVLKGKVVLIDFWAVWCGPCIATFPHLIEWHEQFAGDGLVILGATKYYNYAWNEKAGRANRSEEQVIPEAEQEMLKKFRESYGLHHGFFVCGEDSGYFEAFHVSGIPQAVLIDREGKIAMIQVGSAERNTEALHTKIEELMQ